MNLLNRIGNAWSALTSKSAPGGGYGAGSGGGPYFSDLFRSRRSPSPSELVDAYRSLVYACVNLNANAVARTPIHLYATTKKGQPRPKCLTKSVSRTAKARLKSLPYAAKVLANAEEVEEVTEHPLLTTIMRPNERVGFIQLLRYTVMSLDVEGDAYWWLSKGRLNQLEEIWPLPPHLVYPQFLTGSLVPDNYRFGSNEYDYDELVIFKHESMSNLYGKGYSPTQAAIAYVRLEDTFTSIQDDMLSNGPRPSVVISHKDPKGTFGAAERKRLEDDMNRKGRGGRAGSAFVVDGAVAVTPISYAPTDLGTKELSMYDLERTANCFGVPVSMLKTEDVNRANAEAGLEQHGREAVEPRCKLIASALTNWTHSLDRRGKLGWERLIWAFDSVLSEDKAAEAELHKTYVSMGLPPNVALTEAGYDAVEGGDEPLIGGGLVTLDSIVNPPEPAPQGQGAFGQPGGDGEAVDEEGADGGQDETAPADSSKSLVADLSARILTKIHGRLGDDLGELPEGWMWAWDETLKRYVPCRDERGRFTSCAGGAGAKKPPKKPGGARAGKKRLPREGAAGPKKPRGAGKPKEPKKPKETAKPAEPKKPRETAKPTAKPPKETAKPPASKPTSQPDLRSHYESIKHLPDDQKRQAVLDFLDKHATPGLPVNLHGMTHAEVMNSIPVDGYNLHYPRDNPEMIVKTVRGYDLAGPLPKELTTHTKNVYLSKQANKDDARWGKAYNMSDFESIATGGGGSIVFYNGGTPSRGYLAHEMGHNLAFAKYGSTKPSEAGAFSKATRGEKPPSAYAMTSPAEDFAESVRYFALNKEGFRRIAPQRYEVLDRMFKDPNHGG